jgi:hypothetical protein
VQGGGLGKGSGREGSFVTFYIDGRAIVACFHYSAEEDWYVGYFYLVEDWGFLWLD